MNVRVLALGLLAAGTIGLGGYMVFAPDAQAEAPAPIVEAPRPRAVLTAADAMPAGHLVRPDDLKPLAWPVGDPPAGAMVEGSPEAGRLIGAVTRRAFAAGEVILPGATIAAGERGFLAAIVAPGRRAVALSVEASTAAGGLIWPGDRVDVILTQEIKEDGVPLGQRVVSETILTDTRVLSIDQSLVGAAASVPATPVGDEVAAAAPTEPRVPATVTVEVTPDEAERVTVASALGRLHLALRGVAAATDLPPPGGATWAGIVSPALGTVTVRRPAATTAAAPSAPAAATAPVGVRIYRGSAGAAQ